MLSHIMKKRFTHKVEDPVWFRVPTVVPARCSLGLVVPARLIELNVEDLTTKPPLSLKKNQGFIKFSAI